MECRKYLRCTSAGHEKHYFIAVHRVREDFYIRMAWGRIGKPIKGTKTKSYRVLGDALRAVDRVVQEKVSKGYVIAWENMPLSASHQNVWMDVKRKRWKTEDIGEPDWFDEAPNLPAYRDMTSDVVSLEPKQKDKKRFFRKNAEWNF